ncbi:MAG TPA: cytidine deaminase, partial [Candidatus Dormibacteraeota bacterium]|nr:cytidine deaminase [Candidatus Dormibacteraeota bacterium]
MSSNGGTTTPGDEDLIRIASLARQRAYAPYSRYRVGAAIRTKRGKVTAASNVENASYGLTICAERSAVFQAVNAGDKGFEAVAIVADDLPQPCGACLQVLTEFCDPDLRVVLASSGGARDVGRLGDFLPR